MLCRAILARVACAACLWCVAVLLLAGLRNDDLSGSLDAAPGDLAREYKVDSALRAPGLSATAPASFSYDDVLERARSKIRRDLADFTSNSVTEVSRLDDLIPERGGSPLRNVILSSWRSGTTFLGAMITAVPGTFYHYEPLHSYGSIQIRGPPYTEVSLRHLRKLLTCRYTELFDYQYRILVNHFNHNTRLWEACKGDPRLCQDPEFTSKFCQLFPFQSMKLVRMRLHPFEELMAEKELNLKVILMVRDPRAVLQSRSLTKFCAPAADCWDPARLCLDMVDDYEAAGRLLRHYPSRFMTLRFEDLISNLNATVPQLLRFLELDGISGSSVTDAFLREHTTSYVAGVASTYRVSRDIPAAWTKLLPFDYVATVQEECTKAMSLWGYQPAHNASHLASREFVPTKPYFVH